MQKTYRCDCSRTFDSPQKFNGHKQGCTVHIVKKYGSLEAYYAIKNRNHNKGAILRERNKVVKQNQLLQWIEEKHICEKCGKVMTEKFGSGRFCSRQCANSHKHTTETKNKISDSINKRNSTQINVSSAESKETYTLTCERKNAKRKDAKRVQYNMNPNHCCICGAVLPYNKRSQQCCSIQCGRKLQSTNMKQLIKERGLHQNVKHNFKYGVYNGISCDSSWELAYIVYNTQNNVDVKRNTQYFEYVFKGEKHTYFPDFIVEDTYVEIKNYWTDQVQAKIEQFPKDKKYLILYYEDIKHCIDYCKQTFGSEYWKVLYDRNFPSCLDKIH